MAHPFLPPITPVEARTRDAIPEGDWAYEPKWDGFRAIAWSVPVRLDSRNHKPLLRYFPELGPSLEGLPAGTVVDGEVVVVKGDRLDFDGLQNRIHPATSRIERLSLETPADLVAFDLLAVGGEDLRGEPFTRRRAELESLFPMPGRWHLTPSTVDRTVAERWFDELEASGCDGIVAKAIDAPYREGERAMVKVKHRRTVDCVVAGYRLQTVGTGVGSILLGLYAGAGLHFIGHCSGFPASDRVAIMERLEGMVAADAFGPDGAVRRPGAESRWSGDKDLSWVPVRPELVVEVSYDQLTGGRFRHATRFERWRPDKEARDCTMEQLQRPSGLGFSAVVGA